MGIVNLGLCVTFCAGELRVPPKRRRLPPGGRQPPPARVDPAGGGQRQLRGPQDGRQGGR
eukprot:scaffold176325_cov26-Prasinocladus_malaysianus.AAC.1